MLYSVEQGEYFHEFSNFYKEKFYHERYFDRFLPYLSADYIPLCIANLTS